MAIWWNRGFFEFNSKRCKQSSNLVNLVDGADQKRLLSSLGFKLNRENSSSHIIVCFDMTDLMSIEMEGEFHFWSHFVKESEYGPYKLTGQDLSIPTGNQCLEINEVHKITVNQHFREDDGYWEISSMLPEFI